MARTIRFPADLARAAIVFASARGADGQSLLDRVGLPASEIADPARMLDLDTVAGLLEVAAVEARDADFGLHLGEILQPDLVGPFSFAVLNAPTLELALRNLTRYVVSATQGLRMTFEVSERSAAIVVDVQDSDPDGTRHLTEAGAVFLRNLVRRIAGGDWQPSEIWFRHARPPSTVAHGALAAWRVRFGCATTELRVDVADLSRRIPGANRQLLPVVDRQPADLLPNRREPDPLLEEIEVLIARSVCDGHPSIRGIAPRLGLSVRSLQRRLSSRGLVYRELVSRVRRQIACRYLEETDTELDEIAFLLGYSELSAFDHAFGRWLGHSPGEYRRVARGRASRRLPESMRGTRGE